MLTLDWHTTLEDLEDVCEAWRLIAEGDPDVQVAELPAIPDTEPPEHLLPRLRAVQEEFEKVRRQLAGALEETHEALNELRSVRQAAESYLQH